ncbi:MAG: hypothetical protein QM710_02465 [Flavobacterium sp.]
MKIYIVENSPNEFNSAKDILEKDFGCEVFPKNNEDMLRIYLKPYAKAYSDLKNDDPDKVNEIIKTTDVYKALIDEILKIENPYAYLIDINLEGTEGSGELLYRELKKLKRDSPKIKIFKFTRVYNEETLTKMDTLIDQSRQFENKLGLLKVGANTNDQEQSAENSAVIEELKMTIHDLIADNNKKRLQIENDQGNRYFFFSLLVCFILYIGYSLLKYTNPYNIGHTIEDMEGFLFKSATTKKSIFISSVFGTILLWNLYKKWRTFEKFGKDLETIAGRLDSWITMFFYYFIIISLAISLFSFINLFEKGITPLHIAENLFIVFLPIIIVMSFYFFYKRSMQKIITDTADYDVEQGIKLMNITKTFFISSIISYSIVKVIEVISDKNELKEALSEIKSDVGPIERSKLEDLHRLINESFTNHTILQIGLYFLMIVLLMIFYVKIKHHPEEKKI